MEASGCLYSEKTEGKKNELQIQRAMGSAQQSGAVVEDYPHRNFFHEFCKDIIEGIVAHKHLIKKRPDINTIELYEGKDIKRFSFDQAKNFLIWDKDKSRI